MTDTPLINCEAIRGTLRQWQAEQEPIAAQLSESLAALAAYQSHLDDWQQRLAEERNKLQLGCEQLERDRAEAGQTNQSRLGEVTTELTAARGEIATLTKSLLASAEELRTERQRVEKNESASDQHQARLAEAAAELNAARDKISALTTMLLSRTEELRTLDVRRAEVGTELELARARERELKAALEELREEREWEHAQWVDESRQLREMMDRHFEDVDPEHHQARPEHAAATERPGLKNDERAMDNPVIASVMEQFGKLRQQRAMDRPSFKKTR